MLAQVVSFRIRNKKEEEQEPALPPPLNNNKEVVSVFIHHQYMAVLFLDQVCLKAEGDTFVCLFFFFFFRQQSTSVQTVVFLPISYCSKQACGNLLNMGLGRFSVFDIISVLFVLLKVMLADSK